MSSPTSSVDAAMVIFEVEMRSTPLSATARMVARSMLPEA
jgi:hypothetical protein